ncbi:MAG: ABC transporter ATP-binding protein/permease [Lachnospiraceae bacterium]|nr:ABC transporter ATP-binding protein/permease [Lachnospiraceae bacterium]
MGANRDKQVKVWDGFCGYLKYIWKENKKLYFLGILYFPAFILANYLQVYLPKLVIKELEERRTPIHLGLSILVLVLILAVAIILRVGMQSRVEYGNSVIAQKMRNDYAEKLLYVDYGCLEDHEFITLRNKVYKSFTGSIGEVHDTGRMTDFLEPLLLVVASLGNILVYAMYICKLSPWLLIFLLFLIPLEAIYVKKVLVKQEIRYAEKGSDAWKKMDYTVRKTEDFSMAKDIRLYQMPEWLLAIIDQYIKEGLVYKAKELKTRLFSGYLNTVLFGLYNGCIFASILYQLWHGNITASDLVFYAGMGPALFQLCGHELMNKIFVLSSVSIAFARFQEFIQYGQDSGRLEVPLQKTAPILQAEHVSFTYPGAERPVLQDLNIRVEAGEKIAIVGVNGAGKTTLMKLFCGLLHPTEGRILLNGRDMEEMEAEERYAWFSCVFQDIQFLPLSIRENISMGVPDDGQDMDTRVWKCLEQAGIRKDIERLTGGLDTMMEKNLNQDAVDFSGGQRQKLILARALYRDAGALILDEPTAALDALAENDIYEKYAEFAGNKTSFFVSHRLSSTRFCDRILLIDGGRVAEEGTHGQLLLAEGLYAKMFAMQSRYYTEKGENI